MSDLASIRDPRAYEMMAVFIPDLSDEEVGEQIERVSGYITAQNGTITNVVSDTPWGRRRLAYTIRFNSVDYRDGIYVVIHFDTLPSAINEIERDLKLDTRVMRYLLVLNDPTLIGEEVETPDAEVAGEAAAATEATAESASAADVAEAPTAAIDESAPAESTTSTTTVDAGSTVEAEPAPSAAEEPGSQTEIAREEEPAAATEEAVATTEEPAAEDTAASDEEAKEG